ncbi:Twin-arginine translocation protein TatB [Micrococcus lylae]|uniref:Twin-arginine translocation protein TatB n=1 Tax=Micrococcus lylae TaxID=1273 RepID=A0A1R4IT94_9MICC|nr:twin-arginine translocase TatA/TatE family subunit [Micrococcus lylae]SJN23077.1 Twin-arginine translocation protein TatB [Micrococcus lylae]
MNIGINGGEFIVLVLIALLVLGPERLPEYTRKFTDWLRSMKVMAEGAKEQFKEETGQDFDEIEWRKYDPRQYDPRRMIREALREPVDSTRDTARNGVRAEDLHGGLSRQDIQDMDPRTIFRASGGGSTAASAATAETAAPAATAGTAASGAPAAGGAAAVAAGGAAAALMGSGRAEAAMAQEAPAAHPDTEPDPLDLLGKAPAPFDVDAT